MLAHAAVGLATTNIVKEMIGSARDFTREMGTTVFADCLQIRSYTCVSIVSIFFGLNSKRHEHIFTCSSGVKMIPNITCGLPLLCGWLC